MKSTLSPVLQNLAVQLFKIGAVKFGDFKLKLHEQYPDAPLSPIYFDLRVLRRFPEAKKAAVDVYEELLKGLKFDLLSDIPTAATPFVSSLSDRLQIGVVTPRMDNKAYGSGASVDGMLSTDEGKTAVMLDDLITKATSKIEAANTLKEKKLVVSDIVVLIDRQQGGKEEVEKNGYTLHAAITMTELLEFYRENKSITPEQYIDITTRIEALNKFIN